MTEAEHRAATMAKVRAWVQAGEDDKLEAWLTALCADAAEGSWANGYHQGRRDALAGKACRVCADGDVDASDGGPVTLH